MGGADATYSTSRTVPYVEYYQGRTSDIPTPVQRLQEAAADEARRAGGRQ